MAERGAGAWRPWVGLGLRVFLTVILGWAALAKLADHEQSRLAVSAYRVLPADAVAAAAWVLPGIELLLALLLLAGLFTRWAALATAVLMVLFVAGIASVWIRGFSIDCGCFGGGGAADPADDVRRYSLEIGRDLLFGLMAVWLVIWPRTRMALEADGAAVDRERRTDSGAA